LKNYSPTEAFDQQFLVLELYKHYQTDKLHESMYQFHAPASTCYFSALLPKKNILFAPHSIGEQFQLNHEM
jgi:hypothetical protein